MKITDIRVPFSDNIKFRIIKELEIIFGKYLNEGTHGIQEMITIDGLRIHFEHGWALVRASNTEPLLVTRFEAETEEDFVRISELVNAKIKETEYDIQK